MAASEVAYYVVPHVRPQRGPRPSASLWHRDAAIQPSSVQIAALLQPKSYYPNLSAPSHLADKRLI